MIGVLLAPSGHRQNLRAVSSHIPKCLSEMLEIPALIFAGAAGCQSDASHFAETHWKCIGRSGWCEIFYSLREAQFIIKSWRRHFNAARPYASLQYRLPAPEAASLRGAAPPATLAKPPSLN